MAQKITLVDDLDQTEADETIRFALRGQAYEIDLSQKNVDKLEKALQPFMTAAREAGSGREPMPRIRRARGSTPARSDDKPDYTSVQFAGNVHRGKVTPAEAQTVRDNLDAINKRLEAEGRPTIDPKDAKMKERYGF